MLYLFRRSIARSLVGKKVLSLLLFISVIGSVPAFAQLVRWNPSTLSGTFGPSPWTPASLNAALTSSGLLRGSSISTSSTPAGGCYGGSGGWATAGGETNSFYFTITAACHKISLSSISGSSRRSSSGPASCDVYYAVGAGAYTWAGTWTTSSTSGTTGTAGSTTLSGIAALQNIAQGTVVKIKITPAGSTGNWYFTNTSLALNGTVTAVVVPVVTTSPVTATIPAASGTTFVVSGVTGASSYQWQRNTSGIVGGTWVNINSASLDPVGTYIDFATTATATSNTLTLTNVPASWDGYGYRCVVTNCAGNTISDPALLNVSSGACSGTPASGTAIPTIASFCGAGSTTLNLSGGSSGTGLTYQWSSSNTNTPPGSAIAGATSAAYTTPVLTNTTYYWVTTTCAASSLSDISAVGVVTVNPTPVVVVTPPGGDFCAGTAGLSMTASGANTYSWVPSAGLSATVGSNVTATPTATTIYTITGTSVAGCIGTTAITVNTYVTPGAITVTPSTTTACVGGAVNTISASLGAAGPYTISSGVISAVFSPATPVSTPLSVSGIPTGATITGVSVVFNGTQGGTPPAWNSDNVINLKAPNGNILNLFNAKGGSGSTAGFINTEISSASAAVIPATGAPYTGTYMADAASGVGAAGNLSNVNSWSGLFSIPNGTWQLLGHFNYTAGFTTFTSWTITINYILPSFTWSPSAGLYTDVAGTMPYAGALLNTVYQNPLTAGTATYTVSAANGSCASTAATTVTVNPLPTPISGITSVCSGLTTTLSNGIAGGTWNSSATSVATITTAGVVSAVTPGMAIISYGNGCAPDATATVTVISAPFAISGAASVCMGASISLSNTISGGSWSSINTAIATIDPVSGLITAIAPGVAAIEYTTGCGANATTTVTVIAAPGLISGLSSVCSGSTVSLSNTATGGTWSSNNTAVATVNATGVIIGGVAGNATIIYTTGCGTDATLTLTTIAAPAAITGASSVCFGSTTQLSNTTVAGIWTSNNTTVATVNAAGLVTTGVAGTATISYTTGCGTAAVKVINVIAAPAGIAGASSVCSGVSVTLSDAVTGGTWSSNNSAVATISIAGVVTGGIAGNATISYTTGCGTDVTKIISVISAPAAIAGASSVCVGSTVSLSNAVAGGTWSSSNTAVATVVAGFVTAGAPGSATISYTTGCGTDATKLITVIAAPAAIAGAGSVCSGSAIPLSNAVTGGTWSSNNSTVATVTSAGIVTGGIAGAALINYTTGCGTDVTRTVTVIAAPSAIAGVSSICAGLNASLSNNITGGTWSSSNTSVATVNAASGLVTAGIAGVATIGYTTGCGVGVTKLITVIAAPGAISGLSSICSGSGISLSNTIAGGTWSSNNVAVATVNASGTVVAGAAGSVVITYTTGCGTDVTKTVTVVAAPGVISGPSIACAGSVIILSNTAVGGTWSSSNSAVATVNTSGAVFGVTPGSVTIGYTTGCGASVTKAVTVLTAPAGISGLSSVCISASVSLSNTVTGGTWSSSTPAIATISASGSVTALAPGTTDITYTTGCGMDQVKTISVIDVPGSISGVSSVCSGAVITLSNSVNGGGWSSNNNTIATISGSGDVTGANAGNAVISYTTGCGTAATKTVTVIAAPAAITGSLFACAGATATLSNTVSGGAWTSNNATVATISAAGIVTGGAAGTALITYSNGCGSSAVVTFTVNPLTAAPSAIFGNATICQGNATVFNSLTAGGTWSSSNNAVATIDGTGTATGINAGLTTITYTITGICGSAFNTTTLTVEAPLTSAGAITGPASVCEGANIILSNANAGGIWSSGNTALATVNLTGVVTGVTNGNALVSYTISNSCNSASSTASVTVDPLPAPTAIIGSSAPFCAGTTIVLSNATTGGTWSSNVTAVATVSNSGIVTGLLGGSSTIFYSLTNGCGTVAAIHIVTVDPLPVLGAVTGTLNVCAGSVTALSDTATTGVWSSGSSAIATVNATGIVTGVSAGTAIISYSATNSCGIIAATATVTVNDVPAQSPIIGFDSVCQGYSINLAHALSGGAWSTDFPSIANINNLGVVVGVAPGYDTIRYTVTNSCGSTVAKLRIKVVQPSACNPVKVNTLASVAAELRVFPNPTTGSFVMNLLSDSDEPVSVVITNVVGAKVREFTTATNKEVSISIDAAKGIYLLSAITAHGSYTVKLVVTE